MTANIGVLPLRRAAKGCASYVMLAAVPILALAVTMKIKKSE